MTNSTLFVDSVFFGYDSHNLLQGACFNVPVGHCVGLLGRNGTGKSTLFKIVFGSIRTENKFVRIDSTTYLEPLYQSKNVIKYLPQHNFIPNSLKVKDCFLMFEVDFDEIAALIPDISTFYLHQIGQLSGGWARLIEILLVLYSPAKFVFLDEPFSHLSPIYVELVARLINSQKRKKGIMLSDHLYKKVLEISDDLYLLTNKQTYAIKNQNDLIFYGYAPAK
jgi:ABC-type multidrug transport system ATPase subunit